jgi:putative ABC transport system permease protein
VRSIEILARDLRDAVRGIRQRPGFTALAVLTLALGIGVNGAAITTGYGVLVRPLPYMSPDRIVVVNLQFPDGGDLGFSPSRVDEWLRRLNDVDAAAAYYTRDVTVRTAERGTVVPAAFVTDNFFDVFGAKPAFGRARLSTETPTMIVARDRLPEVLGREAAQAVGAPLTVADTARTVAAVMAPDFAFPNEQIAVWLPARVGEMERGYSKIVARLRPGVGVAQFRAEARRVARELNVDARTVVSVTPVGESIVGRMRRLLVAAVLGSLLVLAVACANVATLFIGRDIARRREYATRLALGARRRDLVSSVLTETAVFALVAGGAGLLLGEWALTWFRGAAAAQLPRLSHLRFDAAAATALTGVTVGAALLTGALPAWHAARGDFTGFLKPTSSSRPGVWMVRRVLVVAQLAFCCMLLIGAGLLVRTVNVLLREDPGFDTRHALAAKMVLEDKVLAGPERAPFIQSVLERTRALPDVREAGFGSNLPPRTPPVVMSIEVENNGIREGRLVKVGAVTPGFLPALGARFLAGRDFDEADARSSTVVLSQSLARFYFGDRDPIGKKFVRLPPMFGLAAAPRVVGVVADVKYDGLDAPASGAVYLPWNSRPFGTGYLIVRTAGDPRRSLADIRRTLTSLDATVPIPELMPLDDVTAQSIAGRRMRAIPAAAFALLALAVSGVGILATLSTLVAERRRDLAIRSALGASRERLLWTIGRQGLTLTACGVTVGVACGALAARGLASLLYGVRPYDAATFAGTVALVAGLAVAMTAISALRTLRIDPIAVLRQEA